MKDFYKPLRQAHRRAALGKNREERRKLLHGLFLPLAHETMRARLRRQHRRRNRVMGS